MSQLPDPRTSNRLKHGARLWAEYVDSQNPRQLDKWLSDRLRVEKKFGSRDRKFYSDLIFSASRSVTLSLFSDFLRREFKLENLNSFSRQAVSLQTKQVDEFSAAYSVETQLWDGIRALNADRVVHDASISDITEHQSLPEKTDFLDAIKSLLVTNSFVAEGEFERTIPLILIAHGIPPAWSEHFLARIRRSGWTGEQILNFLASQNTRAPLWIRLNQPHRKAEVESDLKSHDLSVLWFNDGLAAMVTGAFGVYQCETFKAGFFEVQDIASQQIAAAVRAQPGEKIWDSCAGGGGKTVALASELSGKGALYASDIREHKLREAKRRCLRAGFHNLRTFVWNGENAPIFSREIHLQAGFDAVLVDAPCSSSGTWRRNPDARLRISDPGARESLYQLQFQLLIKAADQVRPGGRIVYGTCSWCVAENESVITRFVNEKPGFFAACATESEGKLLGSPFLNSDTMFVMRLERNRL